MPQDVVVADVAPQPCVRLLCKKQVQKIYPASFPTIWKQIRDGKFPQPVTIGGRPYWREDEMTAWVATRPRRTYKGME
jgi:predicted DNA-binding transcriptional regulator AlpA